MNVLTSYEGQKVINHQVNSKAKKSQMFQDYLVLVYFVTALVPSLTACFASSPGSINLTAVWISRELRVDFLVYEHNREDSVAIRSKTSLTNEFIMLIALLEIPVSG